jgi:hypothetical protein
MSDQQVSVYCFEAEGQWDACQHITCLSQQQQQQQQQRSKTAA